MPKGKGDHEYKAGMGVGRSVHVCARLQRRGGDYLELKMKYLFPETWKRVGKVFFL